MHRIITGVIITASLAIAKSQTTAEEREEVREMSQQMDIANKALNDLVQKMNQQLQESKEYKDREAISQEAQRKVKVLQDKCAKDGLDLSLDVTKVQTYLRCVDKPKQEKK